MSMRGLCRSRGAIIGTAIAGSLCGIALAQETQAPSEEAKSAPDTAGAMVGAWEFSNADHDKTCRFVFRADAAAGGSKLDVDKNCPNIFPTTKRIAGWAVDNYGALRLLDARGNAVIELTQAEAGLYDGFEPGQGRFVLQSMDSAPIRSAEDMLGDWAIARGTGRPICTLTLASNPAGGDALALEVKPGCDALVTRFDPSSWRMDQGELVLLSARGLSWRFEENDADTWQRVPESADPMFLVRQ